MLLELLNEDLIRYLADRLIGIHQLLVNLLAYLLEHDGYRVSGLTVARFLMLLGGQGVVRFLTVIIILIIRAPVCFGKAWRRLERKLRVGRGVQPTGEEELLRRVIHAGYARNETQLCCCCSRCLVSLLGRKSARAR